MRDQSRTKQELLEENTFLKKKIQKLKHAESESKGAQEALRVSETRYRLFAENAMDVIWTVDMDMRLTYVSPSVTRLLGFTEEETMARTMKQAFTQASFVKATQILAEEMAIESAEQSDSTRSRMLELDLVRKDGSTVTVEGNFCFLRDTTGKAVSILSILRDITERKRAADALVKSEEKFRRITENMMDCIAVVDMSGIYQYVTPSYRQALGYDPEGMVGTTGFSLTHPDDLERVLNLYIEGMEQGLSEIRYRIRLRHRNGHYVPMEARTRPLKDTQGNFVGVVIAARDITKQLQIEEERKRAEEAMRESEEKYRLTFKTSPDSVNINRLEDGLYVDINDGFTKLTGFTREDVIGRTSLEINIWNDPADRQKLVKGLLDQGYYENLEADFRHKDGSIATALMSARVISLNGIPHIISITRDITKYRRIENERQSLQERLQRSEKMESLGLLAGGVAHDLNNVLGIVVGYAELLLLGANESSAIRPQLMEIMKGGQKAATIVGDLLTLARRGVSGRDVLNLNKIIAEWQQSPEFEKLTSYHPAVKISTDLDPDLLNISASSVHLSKTLFNLVSNASEAMKKGGCVTIRTTNQYLDKPVQGYDRIQEGDYVVLSVSDTGEGISEDDLKRIFEPFYTKKVMGRSGTGLGLAVVWGTVKDHNGYINVESEEGKGSTFTLYFPITREELSAETVSVEISEYMGKGESILVIDDVKGQRELAEEMLKKLNYTVTSVSSGEEAVAYLKEHKVDLLVLDMIMDPGMDGLNTYRSVLEINPQQKAIIMSGFSESDRVKAAQSLGAGDYVRKPYVIEKLGLAVKKELSRK